MVRASTAHLGCRADIGIGVPRFQGDAVLAGDRVHVLVLYRHSLLGEGLGQLLATETSLDVHAVDVASAEEVASALGAGPDVVVLEEGGNLDMLDILRASSCPVIIDVSLDRTDVWTLRRDVIPSSPGDVVRRIRAACQTSRTVATQTLPVPG